MQLARFMFWLRLVADTEAIPPVIDVVFGFPYKLFNRLIPFYLRLMIRSVYW